MTSAPHLAGRRRGGFTLVELLVAAALCVVIMTVLAVSFRSGMDTLSQMKTIGDLTDKLRSAEVVIRNDLSAYHLEDETGLSVRVSDRAVNKKWDGTNFGWKGTQQKKGFFRATQGSTPTVEGTTEAGAVSRARDHWMHFTTKSSGLTQQDIFTAAVPITPVNVALDANLQNGFSAAGRLSSTWSEVAYFLGTPPGAPNTADNPGLPGSGLQLYTLYRRQRVIAQTAPSTPTVKLTAAEIPLFPDLSVNASGDLNTPLSIFLDGNRLGAGAVPTRQVDSTSQPTGNDILLSNVVSFQIQLMLNNDVDFSDIPGGTWDSAKASAGTRIRGVQIRLRVYDVRNAVTRQMTIQQDL